MYLYVQTLKTNNVLVSFGLLLEYCVHVFISTCFACAHVIIYVHSLLEFLSHPFNHKLKENQVLLIQPFLFRLQRG